MFLPRYPVHVVLVLSNRCNLSCVHCSSSAGAAAPDELSTPEIEAILDQLADVGVIDLALSGGEPLLKRDLAEIVASARARGMRVGTSTNGLPLTDAKVAALRAAGLHRLQVSLDGPEELHDEIRGPGSFSAAIRAIRRSVGGGLRTHVCFTAMRRNHRHLADVIDLVVALGVHGFNLSQFVPVGRGGLADDLDPGGAKEVLEVWRERRRRYPAVSFFAHLAGLAVVDPDCGAVPGFIGCQAGIHIACIGARGDVTPCVMFPLVLGNVRQRSFREIWDSAPAVRDLKRRELQGGCGGCGYRWTCGGCRAASYLHSGSYLGDDPRCWLLPPAGAQ